MVSSTSAIINKRSSQGKQKIEIKKIKAKSSRQVTFSKRRAGLFKKAVELCVLTGAKVAVLVKSASGKVYILGEDLIDDWYLNNGNDVVETGQLGEDLINDWYGNDVVETGQPTNEFNECYGDVSQELAVNNSSNTEQESNIGQLEEMKKDVVDELKMNNNILEKLGSEEMKKNLVMEDDNDSMMINNSQPMFDLDLSLDMSYWQILQWNKILSIMRITALISFHDIDDVEFQDNWGRVWVDIGTSDYFALDVLLNCLTVLSSEYLGIQQVVFGGRSMGDWEEGMKNPKDDHVVEVKLQHDVFDGMFTFYDSTVSTLQIFQVASVTFELLLLLGLGSYLISFFCLLVITTR
nr:hypothetical protein [Tanacetum cinerariifolium]